MVGIRLEVIFVMIHVGQYYSELFDVLFGSINSPTSPQDTFASVFSSSNNIQLPIIIPAFLSASPHSRVATPPFPHSTALAPGPYVPSYPTQPSSLASSNVGPISDHLSDYSSPTSSVSIPSRSSTCNSEPRSWC